MESQYAGAGPPASWSKDFCMPSWPRSASALASIDQMNVSSMHSNRFVTGWRRSTAYKRPWMNAVSSHSAVGSKRSAASVENDVGYMYMCTMRSSLGNASTHDAALPSMAILLPERSIQMCG